MKRILYDFYLLLAGTVLTFTFSCAGDNTSSDEKVDSTSIMSNVDSDLKKTVVWTYDALDDSMVKNEISDSLSLNVMLDTLNRRYNTANLQIQKQSGDTLFVKINDVSFLQQLGSTGNYGFMAEVIYSLTELSHVNCVFLDFEELDHATPGFYTRKDFDNKITP